MYRDRTDHHIWCFGGARPPYGPPKRLAGGALMSTVVEDRDAVVSHPMASTDPGVTDGRMAAVEPVRGVPGGSMAAVPGQAAVPGEAAVGGGAARRDKRC